MQHAVFLSAGIPVPLRGSSYAQSADTVAIAAAVSALVHVTLGRRLLVWGGHPAITPMVWVVAEELGLDYGRWVKLYQSLYFKDQFPEDNERFNNVTYTERIDGDREKSLVVMRERMLSEHAFVAAVFIGGMDGIVEEFEMFRRLQPNAAVLPIASTGGAALTVADRLSTVDHDLVDDLDYVSVFHRHLGISVKEVRYRRPEDQPARIDERLWSPSRLKRLSEEAKDVQLGDPSLDAIPMLKSKVSEPVVSMAIEPRTKTDQEKLNVGLSKLMEHDPTFRVRADQQAGEVVIEGMGELQLEILVDRLRREFNVDVSASRPQVVYKETLTRAADGEMKYMKQTGGRGQYAHAKIHLYPGEPGTGYIFENKITGGSIPKEFIKPIDQGIKEALNRGVLAGYRVDDVRIELYDGSYHDVDSSERAFKIVGSMAFQDAAKKAKPVLLEPMMRVEVMLPKEYSGDVMGDLSTRRGLIQSLEDRGVIQMISARVPLSEMFGYATDLGLRTQGRATYSMYFDRYEPAPQNVSEEAVASASLRVDGPDARERR